MDAEIMTIEKLEGEGLRLVEPKDVQSSAQAFNEQQVVELEDVTVSTTIISVSADAPERQAADAQFRAEMESFAEDWDDPSLDVYNQV